MYSEIIDFLKVNDVEYKENISLASISPIKIGGNARIVAYPDCESKLVSLIELLRKNQIEYKILGRMSNILPSDDYYDGVIIRTDRFFSFSIKDNELVASCGVSLPLISKRLAAEGLSGFEGLSGIPASIGGAIVSNAGAFGREISDFLYEVKVYDFAKSETVILDKEDLDFSYRDSVFKRSNMLILSARFILPKADKISICIEMERCKNLRSATQPVGIASLGSTFKRPGENLSAGKLIDDCGLKGHKVGGAQISEKHAGFIINSGDATANDYIELSYYASKCVFERFGISLQREIEIL